MAENETIGFWGKPQVLANLFPLARDFRVFEPQAAFPSPAGRAAALARPRGAEAALGADGELPAHLGASHRMDLLVFVLFYNIHIYICMWFVLVWPGVRCLVLFCFGWCSFFCCFWFGSVCGGWRYDEILTSRVSGI